MLDPEAASVYTNDALVTRARESGAAERFTASVPTIEADRDTTRYASIFNSTEPLPDTRDPATTTEVDPPATAATDPIPEPRELEKR